METETTTVVHNTEEHLLSDKWILWAHLPHDTDWSLKSYIYRGYGCENVTVAAKL